jgi:MFS family permease
MEAPEVGAIERLSFFTLARESFTGVSGALICGVMIGSFYALGPVYATMVGLDVGRVSTFMASAIVAAMILAWPLGWLCDRLDRRRVMYWVALMAAVASGLVVFFGADRLWLLTLLVALFTGLSATLYPIAVAITNDRMESNRIVAASATLLLSYGVGSVIGPVVMSQLVSLLGPEGLFVGNAGFLILLAVATRYRIASTQDIPVADQEHFFPAMPESSAALMEIDPRNEEFLKAGESPPDERAPSHAG